MQAPPEVLEWEFRRPLLLQEIQESGADIICLQELNHFEELCVLLESNGYTGAFFPKYCSPAEKYQCRPDGLAIFYRTTRFEAMGGAKGEQVCPPRQRF